MCLIISARTGAGNIRHIFSTIGINRFLRFSLLLLLNSVSTDCGFIIFILALLGILDLLRRYIFVDRLRSEKNFYILLLIVAPFLAYFSAHSVAWWLGKGSSLGLLRVMAAIAPIASLLAVFIMETIYSFLNKIGKIVFYAFIAFMLYFLFTQALHINKWGFGPSHQIKMMTRVADYLKENQLDTNFIMAYDVTAGYALDLDPFDRTHVSWYIINDKKPSTGYPDGTIFIWDAHLGNNEGHTPKTSFLNDTNIIMLKEFYPENPIKVLGGYNYEVAVFQKKRK